jgi:hypothetical protein
MKTIAPFVMLLGWSVQASAITIDFEDQSTGTSTVVSQGFVVTGFTVVPAGSVQESGGNKFYEVLNDDGANGFDFPSSITIARVGDQAFAYYSADYTGGGIGAPSFSLYGEKAEGGAAQGAPGQGDWLNVVSVTATWQGFCTTLCFPPYSGITADNIVVGAAVPIPAAVWLLGSGLAALGFARRRKS